MGAGHEHQHTETADDSEATQSDADSSTTSASSSHPGGYSSRSSSATSVERSNGLGWIGGLLAILLVGAWMSSWFRPPNRIEPAEPLPVESPEPVRSNREREAPAEPVDKWLIRRSEPVTVVIDAMQGRTSIRVDEIFTRTIVVDRQGSPDVALNPAGWSANTKECDGYSMPTSAAAEVELTFFKLPKQFYINLLRELADIYDQLDLRPDPYALAFLNREDPSFSTAYPNMVQWGSARARDYQGGAGMLQIPQLPTDGEYRHLKFRLSDGQTSAQTNSIYCGSFTLGWSYKYDGVEWWYAGVRK